jgi:hypothetical protein
MVTACQPLNKSSVRAFSTETQSSLIVFHYQKLEFRKKVDIKMTDE